MKKRVKFLLVVLLIFAAVFTLGRWRAYASEISDAKSKKSQLEQKKASIENSIAQLEIKKQNVLEYIAALDKQLAEIEDSIQDLNYKIKTTQTSLDKTKIELKQAEDEEKKQYDIMKTRIQDMYVNGNSQYLQVIMSSDSLSDFLNRSEYVKQVSKYDKNMFNEFKKIKEKVQEKKNDIEDKLADLNAMSEELLYKKQTVEKLSANKQLELAKYNSSIAKSEQQVSAYNKAIQEQKDELERLIAEQERKAAQSQGNSNYEISSNAATGFVWPTPTSYRITCNFGYRNAPTAGASTYHKGIDIGASSGSPIVSTKAGTVLMTGYNSARGNYVVVSHGNGISSHYYHCSKILVSQGERVTAGQQIAKVGSTGVSTGPHLHFSITINGTYVNPRKYVG